MAGRVALTAPVDGVVAGVGAGPGDVLAAGSVVVRVESMKTEYPVAVVGPSRLVELHVADGQQVRAGEVLATVEAHRGGEAALSPAGSSAGSPAGSSEARATPAAGAGSPGVRPDLAAVQERRAGLTDDRRPEAVRRRRERARRTARANVEDLLDEGSVNEYGGLALASQRSRRSTEELVERTPADGLICATGTVGGAGVAVMAYDATVLAGTQGFQNHRKSDRLIELARRHRLPTVVMAEGGGGRPGDVDAPGVSALDVPTFARFAALAGEVPAVAMVSGYCFAGNAALAGCCDVIVATEDANLGMAGPAMIEGAGLPPVAPTEIGPIDDQWANGVVDVRVEDEAAAVDAVRALVGLAADAGWHDRTRGGTGDRPVACADQSALRDAVPGARRTAYDVRAVIDTLCDTGTVLELRGGWAPGMVTALARLGGRPVGVLANEPTHLGGAIDLEAAASATRFIRLCDRWGLPLVSLCDTPGFMVGPAEEARGQVRAFGDMFLAAAATRVPWVLVVLRKCYGLGAQAMAGGSLHEPDLGISWPTGEFGGMGLEGAVRLGFRRELEAIDDPGQRVAREAELVERAYEHGHALNVAGHFEIDDVVDPADTRGRILAALAMAGPSARSGPSGSGSSGSGLSGGSPAPAR